MYGQYYYRDSVDDPNFDPVNRPTHLTPTDMDRFRGGMSAVGYAFHRFWRYLIDMRGEGLLYRKIYARDAQTGLTHAGVGGSPSNPLQRLFDLRVHHRSTFRLVPKIMKLSLEADYTFQKDLFQNYYTFHQVDGGLYPRWDISGRVFLSLGYGVTYRRYTEDGYAQGGAHPALDNGDTIRMALTHSSMGQVEAPIGMKNLVLFVNAKAAFRTTNYPDYEPNIFPESSAYRINWDYTNFSVFGGASFEI
jgi:hypothetical protein